MTFVERETAVLDRVKASLIADGYDVVTHPTALDLPDFLHNLQPDAVAHRGDEHIVVEVTSRSSATQAKLRLLRHALAGQPGWHLRAVWTSGGSVPRLETPSLGAVERTLREVDELLDEGRVQPAFLLGWAALEAIGRFLIPDALTRPQTPGRVIEYLGSRGFVSRQEASRLRRLVDYRNRLIHGDLQAPVSEDEVIEIRDVLWKLHDVSKEGPQND